MKCQPTFNSSKKCQIETCVKAWHSNSYLASVSEAEQMLEERIVAFQVSTSNTTSSIGLYRDHYNALYTKVRPSQLCASCGVKS